MNRLQCIQALNLKGQTIDAPLTPLTAVIGRNTGGKTAVANAITIALLGHVPALGKKPQATVQLMTPGAACLDVQAVLESGERINRRFDVKRGVKTTSTGPDFSEQIVPIQLDFDQFHQAKPTERQRILEGLMASSGDESVRQEAIARITKAALSSPIQTSLQGNGWLQPLEAEAKDQVRLLKQERDTAAKTILQLQGEEAPTGFNPEALAEVEEKLAAARQALGRTQQALDALAEAQQDAPDKPDGEEVTEAMLAKFQEEFDVVSKAIQDHKDAVNRRKDAENRAEEIMRPHAGIEPVEAVAAPMTSDELTQMDRRLEDQRRELTTATSRARTNIEHAQRALDEATKRRDNLDGMECCPTCGVAGNTFKESVAALTAEDIRVKRAALEAAEDTLTKLEGGVDALVEAEETYKAKVRENFQHAAFLARLRADEILSGTEVPKFDLQAALDRKVQLDDLLHRGRREARAWIEWRAAKVPTAEEVEQANQAFQAARQAVLDLEARQESLAAAKGAAAAYTANQGRITELTRENEQRDSEIAALEDLAKWAKAKSLELTAAAMKPLLDVCNRILTGLVEGEIAIAGTVVGIQRNGSLLPLEVLSGSEAVAVSAAIQIAIAGSSPFRLVMIDELSRFGVERKKQFVENLGDAMNAGLVDQVVLFDHDILTGNLVEMFGSKGSIVTVD